MNTNRKASILIRKLLPLGMRSKVNVFFTSFGICSLLGLGAISAWFNAMGNDLGAMSTVITFGVVALWRCGGVDGVVAHGRVASLGGFVVPIGFVGCHFVQCQLDRRRDLARLGLVGNRAFVATVHPAARVGQRVDVVFTRQRFAHVLCTNQWLVVAIDPNVGFAAAHAGLGAH